MEKPELQPIQAFKDTMLGTALDSLEDIAEIGLDSILEEEFIKDFPVVGFLFRIGKGVASVKDVITAKGYWFLFSRFKKTK